MVECKANNEIVIFELPNPVPQSSNDFFLLVEIGWNWIFMPQIFSPLSILVKLFVFLLFEFLLSLPLSAAILILSKIKCLWLVGLNFSLGLKLATYDSILMFC